MEKKTRVFLALPLAETFGGSLEPFLKGLAAKVRGIKWVRPDQVHVTLHFFGDLAADEIEKIKTIVREPAGRTRPFSLFLEGVGFFPTPGRPRVVWIGLGEDAARVAALQAELEKKFAAAGFPVEDRPFRPHATVARRKDLKAIPVSLLKEAKFPRTESRVIDHLYLYQSSLSSEGPRYEILEKFVLSQKPHPAAP